MSATIPHHLKEHAAGRTTQADERARNAIRQLHAQGLPVSFASVATEAGVSRGFLYKHAELKREITELRARTNGMPGPPAAERAAHTSLKTRLRAALDDNQQLRQENTALRQELAIAHGHVRELRTTQTVSHDNRDG